MVEKRINDTGRNEQNILKLILFTIIYEFEVWINCNCFIHIDDN